MRALVDHLPTLAPDWQFLLLRHASLGERLSSEANVAEVPVATETNSPAGMWYLPQIVDLDGIDLFHAPSNILPRGLKMPTVTTIHDVMWLTDPELCKQGAWGHIERRFYAHGLRRALARSDAVCTVSEATRHAVITLDPHREGRTFTILPGVSEEFCPRGVGNAELAALGLSDRRYILVVGQNAPYKNHLGAIRAFAAAFSEDPGIDLVLVQRRGPRSDALKREAQQLGIIDRVRFLLSVEEEDLPSLYCGATALLHPSFCEGFGMPLAEAMACGCPVITSNRAAMPEVTGGSALLVDPHDTQCIADALVRIDKEPGLAQELSRLGLRRAQELKWQDFAAGNLDVYSRVLQAS